MPRFAMPVERSVFVPETVIFAITVEKVWDVVNHTRSSLETKI
jgi:hypothetical protein